MQSPARLRIARTPLLTIAMDATPRSLLERVCCQKDENSWNRLVALYRPFLVRILQQLEVNPSDLEDLLQDIFAIVVREISGFQHNQQPGAFRRWLRLVVVNRVRGYWRSRHNSRVRGSGELPLDVEDLNNNLDRLWDQEHDAHVARQLIGQLQSEFTQSTWLAFRRQVMDEIKASEVSAELGLSVNAVLIAKSRVLRRFRQEIEGLVD